MIVVCGKAKVKPGALDAARDAMAAMIEASRAEDGRIDYTYGADVTEADAIIVLEYWRDWASLEAHFTAPHMATWRAYLAEAGVVSRDIKAFEAPGDIRQL